MGLDFNLSSKLVLDACPEKLVLLQNLEGDDVLRLFFSGEIHGTEFTLAQRQSDLEVGEAPVLPLFGLRLAASLAGLFHPNTLRSIDHRVTRSLT